MRELESILQKALTKGLRSNQWSAKNEEWLVECYNLVPGREGLEPFQILTDPFAEGGLLLSDGVTPFLLADGTPLLLGGPTWPFPQIFIGRNFWLYCGQERIYTFNTSFETTHVLDVTAGGRWDFIDYGTFLILLNGSVIVTVDADTGVFSQVTSSTTFPRISTGCDYKGQIVGGNVKTTWHGADTKSVVWSRVGSMDFVFEDNNSAGWRGTKHDGNLLRTMRLGDFVVAYFEGGVSLLTPKGSVWGEQEAIDIGILSRDAVGGSLRRHIFVDREYRLWSASADGKFDLLDYEEYISTLLNDTIVVECDEARDEFYIADGNECYFYNGRGLAKISQVPTSVVDIRGIRYGTFLEADDTNGYVTFDTVDFGQAGFKSLEYMKLGVRSTAQIHTSVYWRNAVNASFSQTPWILVSPEGHAGNMVTALDLRPSIRFSTFSDTVLSYVTMATKFGDRRFVRGLSNVAKNVARASV